MSRELRRGETGDSPVAVSTVLGRVLSGPAGKVPGHKLCSVNFNTTDVLKIENQPVSVVSHEDVLIDSAIWTKNLSMMNFLKIFHLIKGDIL